MKTAIRSVLMGGLILAGAAALAQPGPGASAPGMGPGMGGGMGPGKAMRQGPRAGAGITPGWKLMTPEERTAHQQAMAGFKTYDECVAYRDKHHQDMAARMKERGQTMPAQPRRDVCAGLPK